MLLQNPSFSISIKSTEQAAELIAETLRKKNWQQFEATKPQLIVNYLPLKRQASLS